MAEADTDLIHLTADIVSAHVSNNSVASADVAALIQNIYDALASAGAPAATEAPIQEPAVSVRSSVKQDYIVCLEDGKKLKMLKRYLRTNFNMTPEDYRAKWNLPRDYPMVAPAYAEQRRGLAKQIGLGRKPNVAAPVKAVKAVAKKAAKSVSEGLEAARAHLGATDVKASAKPARAAKVASADAVPAKRGRKPKAAPAEAPAAARAPAEG